MGTVKAFQHALRYYTYSYDGSGIFRLVRNAERYTDIAAFVADIVEGQKHMATVPRAENALLHDARLAPVPLNVEAHERVLQEHFPALVRDWVAVAFLTRTAAGRLQSIRLQRQHAINPHTFDNEAEALAYLRSCLPRR